VLLPDRTLPLLSDSGPTAYYSLSTVTEKRHDAEFYHLRNGYRLLEHVSGKAKRGQRWLSISVVIKGVIMMYCRRVSAALVGR